MADTEHAAHESTWDCVTCGNPWPCEVARKQLTDGHGHTELVLYMWACFERAARDMPRTPVGVMVDRFVGWIEPASAFQHPNVSER